LEPNASAPKREKLYCCRPSAGKNGALFLDFLFGLGTIGDLGLDHPRSYYSTLQLIKWIEIKLQVTPVEGASNTVRLDAKVEENELSSLFI
jgi:hypothetical protein